MIAIEPGECWKTWIWRSTPGDSVDWCVYLHIFRSALSNDATSSKRERWQGAERRAQSVQDSKSEFSERSNTLPYALCYLPFICIMLYAFSHQAAGNQRPAIRNKWPAASTMPITCHKCLYYFVTWDPPLPHGCRIMGFKSRLMPATEVRRTMQGKDCLLFKAKKIATVGSNSRKVVK